MNYYYSKLLGKMRECGYTQEKLAAEVGINKATLNVKLKNRNSFQQDEILTICRLLGINRCDIGDYFFTVEV